MNTTISTSPNPTAFSRSGSALLSVVITILITSAVVATLSASARQQAFTFQRQTDRLQALVIAEAGLHEAFRSLAEDITRAGDGVILLPSQSFAGGSYQVRITRPDDADDGVWMLRSTGVYGNHERETAATVAWRPPAVEAGEEGGSALPGPMGAAAIFAGGQLTLSGGTNVNVGEYGAHANGGVTLSGGPNFYGMYLSTNGSMTLNGNPQIFLDGGNGHLHSDGPISLRGTIQSSIISSSSQINGDWGVNTSALHVAPNVSYPDWYSPAPNVNEETVTPVVAMQLPPMDVEAFRSFAQANGWYYDRNQQITRGWLTRDIRDRTGENVHNNRTDVRPAGGILFVDGNVGLSSDMEMYGMIIATGNITVNGGSTVHNITEYPALVSINGNISIGGGAQMTSPGWVYAMNGNVTGNGGASGLTGIVAAQNINLTGGYTLGEGMEATGFTWPGHEGADDATPSDGAGQLVLQSWLR